MPRCTVNVLVHRVKPTPVPNTSIPVLVLDAGYGGLGIARSLGRMGIPVYGTSASRGAPALSSRYWSGTFIWSFSMASTAQSLGFLSEVSRNISRRALIIPTSDTTATFVSEHVDVLQDQFMCPRQSPALIRSVVNKREMHRLAATLDIATARTIFPRSRREVEAFIDLVGFPVIVKAIDPRLPNGTTKSACYNRQAVIEHFQRVDPSDPPNLMLQEFIPGDDDTVWMFNGYFDRYSNCVVAFTGRKIRQYPAYAGVASLGISWRNEQIEHISTRLLRAIRYCGMVDIDYRYDARDRQYKLLDVNPRIGATFRLFVNGNGLDVARICYLDATGQSIPWALPREGRKWLLEDDALSCWRYWKDGKLTLRGWAESLRGVEETAWFALDDPVPLLSRCWNGVTKVFRRGLIERGRARSDSWRGSEAT